MRWRAAAALLLVLVQAGCDSDPCAGQAGGCLAIEVRGTASDFDRLDFSLAGARDFAFSRGLPEGVTGLPVAVRVLLPDAAQGTLRVVAVARRGEARVGMGRAVVELAPRARARVTLSVDAFDPVCPEVVGAVGAGSLVVASVVRRATASHLENAFQLAVDEINVRQSAAGQPPIELHLCDTAGDLEQTKAAITQAAERFGASAVLGPSSSNGVIATASLAVRYGLLMLTPAATSAEITNLPDNDLVWRTAPPDTQQAALLAQDLLAENPAKLAVLYVNSVYGNGLVNAFRRAYPGTLAATHQFTLGGADLQAGVAALAGDAPSHALLVADVDAPSLVWLLAGAPGLASTRFYMTDGARTATIFGTSEQPVPPALLGRIRGSSAAVVRTATYRLFDAAYRTRFQKDPASTPFTANAYDAAYLVAIAAAATQGHVPTGQELAAGLKRLQASGPVIPVGPDNYLLAVQRMVAGGVRLEGASGPLEFDVATGDPAAGTFELWSIDTSGMPYRFVSPPLPW
ncbi:MAG TPA: ABC transporter substrate-binding protein [Polyangia bacterium]|nr:ABC transporter substrate-binding protein [Polyangia bacterium]